MNKKRNKKYLKIISIFLVLSLAYSGVAYGINMPLPDIGAITGQIQSVETAAGGAFSALQGLAGTLGYAPGASGGPFFNPGPGLSEALATVDKLTADVSKMQEEYQNIVINYDKLNHIVNSVENAVSSVENLNSQINSAFNQIPQEVTGSDVSITSPQSLISGIGYEESEFQNLTNSGAGTLFNPQNFISGSTAQGSDNLTKGAIETGSQAFVDGAIYNADGNIGNVTPQINCPSYDNGYMVDGSGNFTAGCTDFTAGFSNDVASSNLYNAGVSAARAHKAEVEGDGFMQEITGGSLGSSSNYYAYQSSVLTVMAEESAANLKNQGYIESQLKQLELSKTAAEIQKNHLGAVILPDNDNNPGMNYYSKTTL